MKNKKEMLILGALYVLFGYFTIGNDAETNIYIFYSIASYLAIGMLFFGQAFYLYPRFLLKKKAGIYLLYSLLFFAMFYLMTSLPYALYIEALVKMKTDKSFPVVQQMFDHPVLIETLVSLGIAMLLGLLYAVIRQWVKAKRFHLLKRITLFSSLTILVIAMIFGIKYYMDVNWKGSDHIHFIEHQTYQSLEEVISQPQFKNKVVYVDLWFTTCGPCLQQFQHLPDVKAQLKDKPVAYLYLAHETSMPNDRQRWKNMIRKFDLNGWHIYMLPKLEKSVWEAIEKNTAIKNRYPHYLLINQQGKVVSYSAHRPQEKEKIVNEIENLLN